MSQYAQIIISDIVVDIDNVKKLEFIFKLIR